MNSIDLCPYRSYTKYILLFSVIRKANKSSNPLITVLRLRLDLASIVDNL